MSVVAWVWSAKDCLQVELLFLSTPVFFRRTEALSDFFSFSPQPPSIILPPPFLQESALPREFYVVCCVVLPTSLMQGVNKTVECRE